MSDRVTTVTLVAKVNGFITDTERASKAVGKVGDEAAKSAAKLREQHDAMREVGAGVAAVGAIAAVAFGLAVTKFAEFDQAMSNVKAATQETRENMGLLRDAALEAGASTVFSATEAANAIEELGKAGLTTKQILGGGLKGALDLAAAGQLSVAEAAGIAAIAVKQFNLEGEDVPRVADLLAAGAGKAVGDVKDLADALNQVGLVANGAGQSIEDTTGVLAAFADSGLLGSDAGTSLKAALIALQAPTEKARDIMEEYNLSFYDTNGQMLAFDEIAGQLQTNLKDLSDEERNATLARIFGNDAYRVANVLYREGAEGIRKYIDQTNDSGYAAKVAADRLNNLTGDVEKLGGALDTALIKSGSGVNDMLRAVTQGATGLVDALGSLPAGVLGQIGALTGLVAVIGLVGGTALIAIPKIAQFKLALATLSVSGASAARGIALASGALALGGIAFSLWASRQAEATANTAEFKDSLDETSGAVTDYTRELIANKLAAAGVFEATKQAGLANEEVVDGIVEGGEKLKGITDALTENNNSVADFFGGLAVPAGIASQNVRDLAGNVEGARKNLKDEAEAAGESADKTTDAATAYQEAADKSGELVSNLRNLIDAVNEANGVGQDAVSANARYQAALAGISDEVDRQKEAFIQLQRDAYEAANGNLEGFVGTLDGFTLSLDEATEAGSANAAMLSGVAGDAQDAARAQFELDLKTMSAKDATDKYMGTLAAQRQAFIDSAVEAGFNADEVQKLTDKVFGLPTEREVKILADASSAYAELERFVYTASGYEITVPVRGSADWTGPGYAEGGMIPGRPSLKDNMIAAVASGEFITRTAQAQIPENRRALEYINAGGVIRGYAMGGMVQPQYATNVPRMASGGGGAGGWNYTQNVFAAPSMSEEQVARISAEKTAFALRGA